MGDEWAWIRWIRGQVGRQTEILVGPGDDCAVTHSPQNHQLITTDMLMDGVDFHVGEVPARKIGWKAMAVNISDIAAMAGVPRVAVVSVALPKTASPGFPKELFAGMQEAAEAYGVAIVGGDTNSWAGGLVISVTLLGEATPRGAVLRSGACPGDWIFVTGPCGGSILGRHLQVQPRVQEALRLHQVIDIHAMIDISDGLSADLQHILEESRCGAVLHAEQIPIHPDAERLCQTSGRSALEHALGDGEDFELIFTVSPEDGRTLEAQSDLPAIKIGECVAEKGMWLQTGQDRRPLRPVGWSHTFGD